MNNNTPDPVALAREVLEAREQYDNAEHNHIANGIAAVRLSEAADRASLAMARAVIDMQAVAEEFAHAATLDRGLSEWESMCDHFAKKFLTALKGETR